jgi:hypothetical protein
MVGVSGLALASAVVTAAPASAGSVGIARINAPGIPGGVLYLDSGGYCTAPGSTRNSGVPGVVGPGYDYDANGTVIIPGVGPTGTLAHGSCLAGPSNLIRAEIYPIAYGGTWDPFTSPTGGAHLQASSGSQLGVVNLPNVSNGAVKIDGQLFTSNGGTANGRIEIDYFQADGFRTPGRGAFGSFKANKGTATTLGWLWVGEYSIFITDKVTGAKIRVETTLSASSRFNIDLDASCFGFDLCQYLAGSPTASGGSFHPLSPSRILDTRKGIGITNGAVGFGDGRLPWEPDPDYRKDWLENHQVKVTGVGGVPEHGVSAVLLNLTVDSATDTSWLGIYPKLPRREIFEDQSWFRTFDPTSSLNFKRGETLPNLVVARVGAGGRIMLENSTGAVHVIADVAGWFDTSGGGQGFVGVTPNRLLDTRRADGGGAYSAGETRALTVTGRAGVPTNASAVVLNVTQVEPTAWGWITVWPTGETQPDASNLNGVAGRTRPNLVVVKTGTGGQVNLFNSNGQSHLIVDVVGYYAPGGGITYPVNPARIYDTRGTNPFGAAETRTIKVTGTGGVPGNATAVIANVTGLQSTSGTFLTVFPGGTSLPTSSNVNLPLADPTPNLVMMRLGPGGTIQVYNDRGLAHVLIDVVAYVV